METCRKCNSEYEVTNLRKLKHKREIAKYASVNQKSKTHDLTLCPRCELLSNRPKISERQKLDIYNGKDLTYLKELDSILETPLIRIPYRDKRTGLPTTSPRSIDHPKNNISIPT